MKSPRRTSKSKERSEILKRNPFFNFVRECRAKSSKKLSAKELAASWKKLDESEKTKYRFINVDSIKKE